MDGKEYRVSIERFGGLEQGVDEGDLNLSMSRSAQNCDTAGGWLRPSPGYAPDSSIDAAPGPIRTLMEMRQNVDGDTVGKIVAATDGDLFWWNDGAWRSISGPLPITHGYFSWLNYTRQGVPILIFANGVNDVYCWKGSALIERLAIDGAAYTAKPQADSSSNYIRLTRHGFYLHNPVVFDQATGKLPSGLTENETYFVCNNNADRFKVAKTDFSSAVDIKNDGTPGWRVGLVTWLYYVIVDPDTNRFHCTAHGLVQNEKLVIDQAEGDGKAPGGTSFDTVYYAQVIDDDYFTLGKESDDPDSTVNVTSTGKTWKIRRFDTAGWSLGAPEADFHNNQILLTNHGIQNGTAVEFTASAVAVLPRGLFDTVTYYVIKVDGDDFKLSTTPNGGQVAITTVGAGGWAIKELTADEWMPGTPTVTTISDTLTLPGHGLTNGTAVRVGIADEASFLPDGLYPGVEYTVYSPTARSFKLVSAPDSTRPINLLSSGCGGWGVRKKGETACRGGQCGAVAGTDTVTTTADHGLAAGDTVLVGLDEARVLPGGAHTSTPYYARNCAANTFQLSLTSGGAAIAFTGRGRPGWRARTVGGTWAANLPAMGADLKTVTLKGHGFAENTRVYLDLPTANGFMPDNITAHTGGKDGKFYYVVNATRHTFQVAEKPGGAPVNLYSAGTPAFRVRPSDENRPMGGSLALHADRLWCGGERSRPEAVYYSDDKNPGSWFLGDDAAGIVQRPTWDGDRVTALASLFDALVAFKADSLFRVVGTYPKEFQTVAVPSPGGTLSPRSVCLLGNLAYFLSDGAVLTYNGSSAQALHPGALKDVLATVNRSPTALRNACAAAWGTKLLLAVPTGSSTENNAVIEYDAADDTLMVRPGLAVACWLPGERLRFAQGNRVYFWGEPTAAAPAMRWQTPLTDFGRREEKKLVTRVLVTGSGGALKVTVRADGRQSSRTVTLPAEPDTVAARFSLRGRRVGLTLENVSASKPVVSGVTIVYEEEE